MVGLLKYKRAGILLERLKGDDEDSAEGRDGSEMALAEALADPVEKMVVQRCQVSCAREKYSFHWPEARAHLDARAMEGPNGEGDEVAVALFPGLCVGVDGAEKVVAKAMVKSV